MDDLTDNEKKTIYDDWISTNKQRFDEWVKQIETYFDNISNSGVPLSCTGLW